MGVFRGRGRERERKVVDGGERSRVGGYGERERGGKERNGLWV